MKLIIKEYTEKEFEIELPCYRKYKSQFDIRIVKIISDTQCMSIDDNSIQHYNFILDTYLSDKYTDATKEEFETQFDKTMKYLINLK